MKLKNYLKAKASVNGVKVILSCRKVRGGYAWYANDGLANNIRLDEIPYRNLAEAKSGLVVTYPTLRYNMRAKWIIK